MKAKSIEQLIDVSVDHLFEHVSYAYDNLHVSLGSGEVTLRQLKEDFNKAEKAIRALQIADKENSKPGYILKQNVIYKVVACTGTIEKVRGAEAKAIKKLFK